MIWELHKDGCEYLYDGHDLVACIDCPAEEDTTFCAWFLLGNRGEWKQTGTKLEAKAWVESKVKEVTANEN